MEDGHRRAKHRGRQETTVYLRNTFEAMGGEVMSVEDSARDGRKIRARETVRLCRLA